MTGWLKCQTEKHTHTLLSIMISLSASLLLRSIWINSWVVQDRVFRFLWTYKLNKRIYCIQLWKLWNRIFFLLLSSSLQHFTFHKAFSAETVWNTTVMEWALFAFGFSPLLKHTFRLNVDSVVWVRERTIPTERPLLVDEASANFCG
jgi:hypothetical protein